MIFAAKAAALSSRFAPMPFGLHIGFCVVATAVFLISFALNRKVSSLIWALICDATAILQFYNDRATAIGVGICEIVLFIILFWMWLGERKEQKNKPSDKSDENKPDGDDRDDIAKLVKTEMKNLADDGKDDIISNAFEDDRP